ncbi:MAG: hypothetical protein K0U60_04215 [Actinomycetia bacterium]|nr:hypothetical protein [Actinomycetes bacterium]MCH9800004.1 hypothetical protein [Actinomycetes bacterium]
MKSEAFLSYVRDQVIFISVWLIAVVLWFVLGLMVLASENLPSPGSAFVGSAVIGLFILIVGLGTVRRLQLLSKDIPQDEHDTAFAKDFQKQPWPIFMFVIVLVVAGVLFAHFSAI